jgi:hypothetical protein
MEPEIKCAWCEAVWEAQGMDWVHVAMVREYYGPNGRFVNSDHDFCCLDHMLSYNVNIQQQLDETGSAVGETFVQYNQRMLKEAEELERKGV